MSQKNAHKNESINFVLAISLVLLAIAGITALPFVWPGGGPSEPKTESSPPDCPKPYLTTHKSQRRSLGEEILVTENKRAEKQEGVQAFAQCDFDTAIAKLEASLKKARNDPEALIYLNNAKAAAANGPVVKIVVSVPIGRSLGRAKEILRGVAHAQNDVNQQGGINGALLLVEIANDDNDRTIVPELAQEFVEDSDILAVVGHNSSNASIAAAPVYDEGRLVAITPTSYSTALSGISNYVFRTVPHAGLSAKVLASYVYNTAYLNNIAICADSKDSYSRSFKEEFTTAMTAERGGNVTSTECDFSDPTFNSRIIQSKAISDGADGLLLVPSVNKIPQAIEVARGHQEGQLFFFGSPTMYTGDTIDKGREHVNGMVFSVPWHPEAIEEHPFPQAAEKLWRGSVNWRTAMAYDATLAIIQGLKQNNTREGLRQALKSEDFQVEGATGTFKFDRSGDRQGNAYIVRIEPNSESSYGFVLLPE